MKKKTSLKAKLRTNPKKCPQRRKESLWKGPEKDGITQSMISGFLECRERFRLRNIVGLKEIDQFNHRIEYGQMWHICEEALAGSKYGDVSATLKGTPWLHPLLTYAKTLCKKYPTSQEQINHWYQACQVQFPIYVKYWEKHKDTKQRTPLLQEERFKGPYQLPSNRVVLLRGKWDGVDLIGKGKNAGVYLQENKTKGNIKEEQMKQQLGFDLQTMFYLVALTQYSQECDNEFKAGQKIQGVRYNVVRRPLSGGVGTIRRLKPTKKNPQGESAESFYSRLSAIIDEDPGHFYMRWRVEVTPADLERFKREFLDPILEQVWDWYEWNHQCSMDGNDPFNNEDGIHWRTPYGAWNSLAQGYSTELDEYLVTGSMLGLKGADKLFTELE